MNNCFDFAFLVWSVTTDGRVDKAQKFMCFTATLEVAEVADQDAGLLPHES